MEEAAHYIDTCSNRLLVDYIEADLKFHDYEALAVHVSQARAWENEYDNLLIDY
jgi:hypothetical protein